MVHLWFIYFYVMCFDWSIQRFKLLLLFLVIVTVVIIILIMFICPTVTQKNYLQNKIEVKKKE